MISPKVCKNIENGEPKGSLKSRKTHQKSKKGVSKNTTKKNSISKNEKNIKWITQRPEPPRFLAHGEG